MSDIQRPKYSQQEISDYNEYCKQERLFCETIKVFKQRSQIDLHEFMTNSRYGYNFTEQECGGFMNHIFHLGYCDYIDTKKMFPQDWQLFVENYEADYDNVRERFVGRYSDSRKKDEG